MRLVALDSSRLACSAAILRRCIERVSREAGFALSIGTCASSHCTITAVEVLAAQHRVPAGRLDLEHARSTSRIDTSKVPPPRSNTSARPSNFEVSP